MDLDYPTAIAALLRDLMERPKQREGEKVPVDCESLRQRGEPVEILPCVNVEVLIKILGERPEDGCVEELKGKLGTYLKQGVRNALPRYPTEEFVRELAKALGALPSGEGETGYEILYDEYSKFVHAYDATRVIAPFTSVAEAAILAGELRRFNSVLEATLNGHLDRLRQRLEANA
jgi:hypothetical protein